MPEWCMLRYGRVVYQWMLRMAQRGLPLACEAGEGDQDLSDGCGNMFNQPMACEYRCLLLVGGGLGELSLYPPCCDGHLALRWLA